MTTEGTDKYFLRSKEILEAMNINPYVRYQIFARKDMEHLQGVEDAVYDMINSHYDRFLANGVHIYALEDGMSYKSGEPLMKIEGPVQALIDLETRYLQISSAGMTGNISLKDVRENAGRIRDIAWNKRLYYFGARHYRPSLDERIAEICFEAGYNGCSTDIGASVSDDLSSNEDFAWEPKGIGTIPHALILAFASHYAIQGIYDEDPFLKSAEAFDKIIDTSVPRIFLIDTFNTEIDSAKDVCHAVPSTVGVRIDTCGENYSQYAKDIILPEMGIDTYTNRKGVSIAAVWALREQLDVYNLGNIQITVSSGFNAEKTKAFMIADKKYQEIHGKPLFDAIGTGSLTKVTATTSDIVAYKNNGEWFPMTKVGRGERHSDRLQEIHI